MIVAAAMVWTREPGLSWLKALFAVLVMALLAWELRNPRLVAERTKRRVAFVLSLISLSLYFQFFHFEYDGYFHRWDVFHYYVGSKYAPELGYERLYACTAIADAETGNRARVERRKMRELADDRLIPAESALRDPDACKRHFTPARWTEFSNDVVWFRRVSDGGQWWDDMQTDHGYNPSPVWTATGRLIASHVAPSVGAFRAIALVDLGFIAGCLGLLSWAFGWRVASIAAIFWGTQAPSPIFWIGGSFLRLDWLFWAVLAVALVRRRHSFWAGATLAYSGWLRLFPLLLFAGPVVLATRELVRTRTLTRPTRSFIAGAIAASVVLFLWGLSVGGLDLYADFLHHSWMHSKTPITNHMSLRTLFSFEPGASLPELANPALFDPGEPWAQARVARLDRLHAFYLTACVALVGAFAYCVWSIRTRWMAICLSLLVVIALTDPSCYYFLAWILIAPLARARRSLEVALIGASAIGQFLVLRIRAFDEEFVALAALYVVLTFVIVLSFARSPKLRHA